MFRRNNTNRNEYIPNKAFVQVEAYKGSGRHRRVKKAFTIISIFKKRK